MFGEGGVAWIHGYTMSSRIWSPLWSLLPDTRHVGIDLPGHGERADVPLPGSLAGLAADAAEQVRRSGARTLVGLSFGSCVALQVALDHPGDVDALVLAAPTLAGMPDDPAAAAKYFLLMRELMAAGPGPTLARIWMADPPRIFTGLREHPQAYAQMAEIVAGHSFAELRTGAMAALARAEQPVARLAELDVPTQVVVGTDDMPRFLETAALLGRTLPRCTVHVVPGTGHLPLLERPRECAEILLAGGRVDGPPGWLSLPAEGSARRSPP